MDPNSQNQSIQPDYGFITDQPQPDMPTNKGMQKKVVVLIVLFVLLCIVGIAAMIMSSTQNKVAERPTIKSTTVDEYVKLVQQNETDKAYQLLYTSGAPEKSAYKSTDNWTLVANLKDCSVTLTENFVIKPTAINRTEVTCKDNTGNGKKLIVYTVVENDKEYIRSIRREG